ncbi:MAG TPA: PEGA domain-containing protein, partial [Myxococcaceae bacterium]|nr:PEGA domain-containing protein [Myxococcaceae bacterium]
MAALVGSALLAATAPAGGASGTPGTAVVALGHCEGASTAIAARSFRTLLQPKLGPALQDEAQTARPLGGLAERTLDEIDHAVAAARKDFYAHKADGAAALLKALSADVAQVAPSEQRWKVEREVWTLLAQVQVATDAAAAETALVVVLRVEPGYQPDTALYPPTFRKFADGVRERLAEVPRSRLDVAVTPPGTAVYVGGKPAGTAPLSIHVPPGDYRVEADFGHRGLLRLVKVPAPPALAPPLELGAGVEGALQPDAGPCVEPGPDPAASLARLAALIGARRLYAVRSESSGGRAFMAVAEVEASGQVLREARAPVQPGAPESDALTVLAEWVTTGKAAGTVEVLKRAVPAGPVAGKGQIAGRVLGQPAPAGLTVQVFPEGDSVPADGVRFDGDRFKRTDVPSG